MQRFSAALIAFDGDGPPYRSDGLLPADETRIVGPQAAVTIPVLGRQLGQLPRITSELPGSWHGSNQGSTLAVKSAWFKTVLFGRQYGRTSRRANATFRLGYRCRWHAIRPSRTRGRDRHHGEGQGSANSAPVCAKSARNGWHLGPSRCGRIWHKPAPNWHLLILPVVSVPPRVLEGLMACQRPRVPESEVALARRATSARTVARTTPVLNQADLTSQSATLI